MSALQLAGWIKAAGSERLAQAAASGRRQWQTRTHSAVSLGVRGSQMAYPADTGERSDLAQSKPPTRNPPLAPTAQKPTAMPTFRHALRSSASRLRATPAIAHSLVLQRPRSRLERGNQDFATAIHLWMTEKAIEFPARGLHCPLGSPP